jgi:hypothetical protein
VKSNIQSSGPANKRKTFHPTGNSGVIKTIHPNIKGVKKVDITKNEYRFRIRHPSTVSNLKATDFDGKLPDGVYVVRGIRGNRWVTQSVRFKKDKYSLDEATSWLKAHPNILNA